MEDSKNQQEEAAIDEQICIQVCDTQKKRTNIELSIILSGFCMGFHVTEDDIIPQNLYPELQQTEWPLGRG